MELEGLCRACGLCCDGTLFQHVPLSPGEEPQGGAGRGLLRVLPDGTGFEQPCAALARDEAGCSCRVYASRPRACRTFVCRLHERHRLEGGPLAPRLHAVRRVRELLAELDRAGLSPLDFEPSGRADAAARALHAELLQRLERDLARA